MSDEFQLGSGNWWDGTRNRYDSSGGSTAAPVSTALNNNNNNNNSFGWQTEMVDMKGRSSMDSASTVSGSSMGLVFPTDNSHRLQLHDSSSSSSGAAAAVNLITDPNLHMMGLGLSSQTMDWNQALYRGEKTENSFRSMLQETEGNANFEQDSQEQQWRHKLLFGGGNSSGDQDNDDHDHHFKQFNRTVGGLSLDQGQQQPQYTSSQSSNNNNSSSASAAATNFHVVDSAAPSPYGNNNSPNILQGLLVSADNNNNNNSYSYPPPPPMDNSSYIMNHHHQQHLIIPSSSSSNSWSKFPHQFLRTSSSPPPSAAKQQPPSGQLHFSNNTPFWNAISTPNTDATRSSCSFFPSIHQTQQLATSSSSSFEEKQKQSTSEVRDFTKKSGTNTEASNKRSRNETTPPMPAFKVRKEKMGDRITALQQLVSPFGKTDTASVLSEAIEYIKFLHEQVSVLSTPYMKSGGHIQHPAQIPHEKSNNKDPEGPKQDLRSRGLCLVPVPSTFPVMNESNFDFWNPTFGGTYR